MRQGGWVALALAAVATVGCATSKAVSLDQVLCDGRDNEVHALEEYEHQRLQVSGAVEKFGLRRTTELSAEHEYMGWQAKSTLRKRHVRVPYLVMLPEDPSLGSLLCIFEEQEREQVADLVEGGRETVTGDFQDLRPSQGGRMLLVFTGCELQDR